MSEEKQTEAAVIERIVRASTVQQGTTEVPFVVVPPEHKIQDLEALQDAPRRVRENLSFHTVDSFTAYLKEWTDADSIIFADDQARTLKAVIDYHESEVEPQWGDHKASYTAKLSREAQAWMGQNGKGMAQVAFAEFLEERIADVVEPAGASLLELATKLQVIQQATFGSAIKLNTGEFQLQWGQENQKGTVELPEKIALGIPLFHNGEHYRIEARLRYRLSEGKVTFTYKLVEIERALEHAFAEVVAKVRFDLPDVRLYNGARG